MRQGLTTLPTSVAQTRRLRTAASASPRLAAPPPDFADPAPPQGGEDEIWMVSYMDIMTLLLTFFVVLFVYTRTVAPDVAVATDAHRAPPPAEAPAGERPAAGLAAVRPAAQLAPRPSLPAAPSATDPTPLVAAAAVTNPTVAIGQVTEASTTVMPTAEPMTEVVAVQPDHPAGEIDLIAHAPVAGAATPPHYAEVTATTDEVAAQASAVMDRPVPEPTAPAPPDRASEAEQTLLATIQASELGRRMEVSVRKDAVNLEISDEILFDRGSAALKRAGEALLADLANLLTAQPLSISVEGHTDDAPIHSARFASNWELSAARATNVTHSLIAHAVDPARVRAIGYADTHPRDDNASEQGRARNRRVTLVLHIPAGGEAAW